MRIRKMRAKNKMRFVLNMLFVPFFLVGLTIVSVSMAVLMFFVIMLKALGGDYRTKWFWPALKDVLSD
jgi:hypothetical protein